MTKPFDPHPSPASSELGRYSGPEAYALADWRRRIFTLYAQIREMADPAQAHAHWLDVRSAMFRDHPMSPLPEDQRADFAGIACAPYDPAFRFSVRLRTIAGDSLSYDLARDGTMRARPIATTEGLADALGGELMVLWIEGYGGGMFIPFTDATSGAGASGVRSYGGGRYLADAIKGSDLGLAPDGRLIVDFNFAYNPSCALSDAYVCPLSPPENRLKGAVLAGETV